MDTHEVKELKGKVDELKKVMNSTNNPKEFQKLADKLGEVRKRIEQLDEYNKSQSRE